MKTSEDSKYTTFFLMPILCALILIISCGSTTNLGGSEAGNPNFPDGKREIIGVVPSATGVSGLSQFVRTAESVPCESNQVIAIDNLDEETSADVESDCSFSILVEIDKIYSMRFLLSETEVARLVVDNNNTSLLTSYFVVSDGEEAIDLGNITFEDGIATPEFQPATQNDQDVDVIDDFDDDDDDGDGTLDEDEGDCDGDLIPDDYDLDNATCPDTDGDGVADVVDNCPSTSNASQTDTDGDGSGDACDSDDDDDGVLDGSDNCQTTSNSDQTDTDGDGEGDACDTDDDEDGVLDGSDNCPLDSNPLQEDRDFDGVGNACD